MKNTSTTYSNDAADAVGQTVVQKYLADMEAYVTKMRELGVIHYKQGALELTIVQELPVKPSQPEPEPAIRASEPRGRDGLSPTEQMELYGRVMDAHEA